MSLCEYQYDVFIKHYISNCLIIMNSKFRFRFSGKIRTFKLLEKHLNRCHYLFHFLYRSQNKYTLFASRKSSGFVEMVSSTIVKNLACFISGSITSLTSSLTFVFLADGFRGFYLLTNNKH